MRRGGEGRWRGGGEGRWRGGEGDGIIRDNGDGGGNGNGDGNGNNEGFVRSAQLSSAYSQERMRSRSRADQERINSSPFPTQLSLSPSSPLSPPDLVRNLPPQKDTEYVPRYSFSHELCNHLSHEITHNTIQYNTIQYNTIQYNTIQYNTIQYNTIQYTIIRRIFFISFFFSFFSFFFFFSFFQERRRAPFFSLPPFPLVPTPDDTPGLEPGDRRPPTRRRRTLQTCGGAA